MPGGLLADVLASVRRAEQRSRHGLVGVTDLGAGPMSVLWSGPAAHSAEGRVLVGQLRRWADDRTLVEATFTITAAGVRATSAWAA